MVRGSYVEIEFNDGLRTLAELSFVPEGLDGSERNGNGYYVIQIKDPSYENPMDDEIMSEIRKKFAGNKKIRI